MNFQCSKMQCLLCGLMLLVLHVESAWFCGKDLDEILKRTCPNGFNGMMKRGFMDFNGIDTVNTDLDSNNYGAYPYVGLDSQPLMRALLRESAHQLQIRRRREGVNDECCKKPCSYDELLAYCK